MRFGQIQRLRKNIKRRGKLAGLYVQVFGTTSLFGLHCHLLFRRAIAPISFTNVMDAGCGQGDFAFRLAELYPQAKIEGWDVSEIKDSEFDKYRDNIDVCKEIQESIGIKNIHFLKKDLFDLDEENKYDLIYCLHVLEHINDLERVLSNFYRALRPGGALYIQTPSKNESKIGFMKRYLKRRIRWEQVEHTNLLSLRELVNLVENAGFKVEKAEAYRSILVSFVWQMREALVEQNWMLVGVMLLPFLKLLIFFDYYWHRWSSSTHCKFSELLREKCFEVNLEILAVK